MRRLSAKNFDLLTLMIGVPVVGILMGGMYSLPAMRVTGSRDPAYTILLGAGLSVTVIGIGMAADLSLPLVSAAWLFAMLVLMTRRLFGKLDHNVERFGLVHALTLVGMFWVVRFFGSP